MTGHNVITAYQNEVVHIYLKFISNVLNFLLNVKKACRGRGGTRAGTGAGGREKEKEAELLLRI